MTHHLVDHLVEVIALALVILAIVLAVAFVLAVAVGGCRLRAPMRGRLRRLRRAAMLTIWATVSLLVIAGLGAAVNDAVHMSNLATNEVGIEVGIIQD